MSLTEAAPFGLLLKQLRKRAGMTQRDLGAALNYSDSLISSLEKAQRQPDLDAVISRFVPALGLQDDPISAARLIEYAAAARGERPPEIPQGSAPFPRAMRVGVQGGLDEQQRALLAAPTELIGRNEEVNRLCNRLLGHSGRLLTLVGPPGIGKTRLAQAVAARLQHNYADGAVFVALAEITDPVQVASAILAAVGSRDSSSKAPKVKLIERLRRKTMLLVLDNCEQIRDAGLLVAEVLSSCAGLVLVATSRERLHLRAEQRYHVPPLDLGPAVELFSQRAVAVNAIFELTEFNRRPIEAICERLDRLPLALELCAAQTDLHSLPQLLAQLHDRRLDLLVDGAHDLPPQQRTLRRAIQRSYTLLTDEERTLFRSLGTFAGGFDLRALELVGVSSLEVGTHWETARLHSTFHTLIGKSLVRVETTLRGEQRFLLLETLREFALEQLRAQGEEAEMRQRHYLAYLQLFRVGNSYLGGAEEATWVTRLEPEQENLRAALQWKFDQAHFVDVAWLIIAVIGFWFRIGHRYKSNRWIARLLPYRQSLPVDLRLAMWIGLDYGVETLEEVPPLERYMAELIELMEICPYKQLNAAGWYFLAFYLPDATQAASALERSLLLTQTAREGPVLGVEFCGYADDDFRLANIEWGYGNFLISQGEVARATSLLTDSLQHFRKQGNNAWVGDCVASLGLLALLRGDIAEAHQCFQEVVTIGTTYNLPVTLSEWQSLLGLVTLYSGNAAEARRLLEECLHLCLEVKNSSYLTRVCMCLAEMCLWEENADEAGYWLGQSVGYLAASQPFTMDDLQRLFVAARLATIQGQYSHAATLMGVIEVVHRRIHYAYAGPMMPLVNAALSKVREALDVKVFDEAFAAGQQLSLDEAYATLLVPVPFRNIVTLPTPT